jgi:hypothetical protein
MTKTAGSEIGNYVESWLQVGNTEPNLGIESVQIRLANRTGYGEIKTILLYVRMDICRFAALLTETSFEYLVVLGSRVLSVQLKFSIGDR